MLDYLTRPTGLAPVVDALLAWAIEATVVAAVLAAVAALLGRSRRLAARPATRHALWLMVLVKLATPPLLAWPWPVPRPNLAGVAGPAAVEPPPLAPRPRITTPSPSLVASADDPAARPIGAAAPPDPSPVGDGPGAAAAGRPPFRRAGVGAMPGWRAWVALVWVGGGLTLAARHARRVLRFRRRLVGASPAPGWLLAEVGAVARRLGVGVPPVRVVPRLGTPVLWCLGRPTLLVPGRMLSTLARDGWPAILAHELAHLRRGDPWVRRLELVAGLAWWWNPLYWLVRRRLDFEAELACDAWAVWAAPRGRIAYAESLIRICAGLSPAGLPTPALGVAGTGRSFERRLTMILRTRSHHRLAAPHLLGAALLAGLTLPSWTWADPVAPADAPPATSQRLGQVVLARVVGDDPDPNPSFDPDPNLDFDFDFADDDEQADGKNKKDAAKALAETIKAQVEAELAKTDKQRRDELARLRKQVGSAKTDGEQQAEMARLQKQMEAMGKDMEARFGPDSEFAKNMEKQFGPDSEFAKNMEKQFGPDSEFVKNMEKQFGPDSEFARELAKPTKVTRTDSKQATSRPAAETQDAKNEGEAKAARDSKDKKQSATRPRTQGRSRGQSAADRRASRIDALEARINGLMAELKSLKAESANDDDDDEG